MYRRASVPSSAPAEPVHLFVIIHGYMGIAHNVDELAKSLRRQFGSQALVFVPNSFGVLRTLDGIDVCSRRVLVQLRALVAEHPSLRALSLVGYSMGGLMARYLAGALLVAEPAPFLGLTPTNLVTIACPHLGPRLDHSSSISSRLFLLLGRTVGGRSGLQMTNADGGRLLALMACRRSAFHRGLAAFERRALYANAHGDNTVPFWSAFVSTPWQHGTPAPPPEPPPAHGQVATTAGGAHHPHIEWEGVGLGATVAENHTPTSYLPREGFSWAQAACLCALLLFALCIFLPIWLTVVLPTVLTLSLCRGVLVRECPPLDASLIALHPEGSKPEDGGHGNSAHEHAESIAESRYGAVASAERWSIQVLEAAVAASTARAMQEWMAGELNSLVWHKASVRFTLARDGLLSLHTHGHIVVRSQLTGRAGMDVLAHAASNMMHPRV